MEKTVYCLLHSRRKRIKYVPTKHVSEVNLIRQSLVAACKTDSILEMMMKDKVIVLQTADLDVENEWCDIEDTDVIVDKSEIKVLLIEMPPNVKPAPNTLPGTSSVSYNPAEDLNAGETVEMDIKVLYTEPIYQEKNLVMSKNDADLINNIEHEDNKSTDEIWLREVPVTHNLKTKAKGKENEQPHTAGSSGTQMSVAKNKIKVQPLRRGFIPNPAILPLLSFDLQKKLDEDGIENSQHHFIRFWGEYLWQETRGQPSKQDYNNLAASIVAAYPLLAGGSGGNGIVRGQLSVWIRNHRANSNRAKNKAKKRNHDGKEVQLSASTSKAVMVKTDTLQIIETDLEAALAELKKKFVPGKNTSHIKRLLEVTKSDRRDWIENKANRIVDIVEKYPPLSDYEMILFECITIVVKTTEDVVFQQIDIMISELRKYYSVHGNTEDTGTTSDIEKINASILEQLFDELALKRMKKKILPLCTVKQVLGSTQSLVTHEGDAPRIVMFMTEEGKIGQALIVADKGIHLNVPDPTVPKIIAGLLSTYYAWHRAFPPGYSSALEFMAYKVFKIPVKSSPTVTKFLRKLDNFLGTSSSECNE